MNEPSRLPEGGARDGKPGLDGFDLTRVGKLRDILGDATVTQLFEMLLREVAVGLSEIRQSDEYGHRADIVTIAHGLKGVAGNIGGTRITEYAARLETAAREGHEVRAFISELEAAMPNLELVARYLQSTTA